MGKLKSFQISAKPQEKEQSMNDKETARPKKSYLLPMGKGDKIERQVEHIDWDMEAFREGVRNQPRIVETDKDIGQGIYCLWLK